MNAPETASGADVGAVTNQLAGPSGEPSGYLIMRLHHTLRRALDKQLGELGINTAQYVALRELGREQALSAATLAKRAYVRPQAMTSVIAGLEERGLVERSPHRYNRRIIEVRLTEAGRGTLTECVQRADAVEEKLLTGLGNAERAAFRKTLDACLANMDPPWYQAEAVSSGEGKPSTSPSVTGHELLDRFLAVPAEGEMPVLDLLGSAAEPEQVQRLTQWVYRDLTRPLAARIDADHPELRADMVTALLLGISVLRATSGRSGLARAEPSAIAELFGRALEAMTTDPAPEGAEPTPSPRPPGEV